MTIAPRPFCTEKQMHFVGKRMWSGVEQCSDVVDRRTDSQTDRPTVRPSDRPTDQRTLQLDFISIALPTFATSQRRSSNVSLTSHVVTMQILLILLSRSISTVLFAPHKELLNATCTVYKALYDWPNETKVNNKL